MSRLLDHARAGLIGYVAAVVAAGYGYTFLLALAVNVFGTIEHPSEQDAMQQFQGLMTFGMLASAFIAAVAIVPALVAGVVVAWLGLRNIVWHILAGIAVSIAAVEIMARRVIFMEDLTVNVLTLAAGAIGGMAYWAVGRWLGPRTVVAAAP